MTSRKKTVKRKKSGGRRKDSERASSSRTPEQTRLKAMHKASREQQENVPHLQSSGTFFIDYDEQYAPTLAVINGDDYVSSSHRSIPTEKKALELLDVYEAVGYDVWLLKLADGEYAIMREMEPSHYEKPKGKPDVVQRITDLNLTGGWSTLTNGMGIQTDSGQQPISFVDKLDQLNTHVSDDVYRKYYGSWTILGRLSDEYLMSGRPQTKAHILAEVEVPIGTDPDQSALAIYQSAITTFGTNKVNIREASRKTGPTTYEHEYLVFNGWEPGHGTFARRHRFGSLEDAAKEWGLYNIG